MTRIILSLFISIYSPLFASGNSNQSQIQAEPGQSGYYTCSMHPHIHEDKPGKCPICNMNLTFVETENDTSDVNSDHSPLTTEDAQKVIAQVKLRKSQLGHFRPSIFPVSPMKMSKKIRLLGTILPSEEQLSNVTARIPGRVEKVFIKSTGTLIKEGDPVVEIYSPRLISAGEEYLIAHKAYQNQATQVNREILQQSEKRLLLWGMSKNQVNQWVKSGKVPTKIKLYSKSTGVVRKRNALVGKYFKEGQDLFELSDLTQVWAELDVYEHDSNLVTYGQKITLSFAAFPGQNIEGEIDFIAPILNPLTRTLKIRATIKNDHNKLRPGMVADGTLQVDLSNTPLVVPRSAVIDTGKRKVVWLQSTERQYTARVIKTGYESEGYVEILQGLREGDQVVLEGSFLLDAQAQLFGGYEDMTDNDSIQ